MLRLAFVPLLVALCWRPSFAQEEPGFQSVEVKPGETLWDIANRYLKQPEQWDQIVRHNPKLALDPTVALPGMRLRVPVGMLKPEEQAAELTYIENAVKHRRGEAAQWGAAALKMPLRRGDRLSTGEMSRARIRFPHGSVLNLESHSEVEIDPLSEEPRSDLKLVKGKLKALHLKMKARQVSVLPQTKDAVYEIALEEGEVKVDVYGGLADVRSAGSTVRAAGGQSVPVADGLAPPSPRKLETDAAAATVIAKRRAASRAEGPLVTSVGSFEVDLKSLRVGSTVAGFRVQAAASRGFDKILFDRMFEIDEEVTLKNVGLPAGVYWWRVAPVDLLGALGGFSAPRQAALR